MNALEGFVKVIILLVFLFGILCGALGDEAFRWCVERVNDLGYG